MRIILLRCGYLAYHTRYKGYVVILVSLRGDTKKRTSDHDILFLSPFLENNELEAIYRKESWFCKKRLEMTEFLALTRVLEEEDKALIRIECTQECI